MALNLQHNVNGEGEWNHQLRLALLDLLLSYPANLYATQMLQGISPVDQPFPQRKICEDVRMTAVAMDAVGTKLFSPEKSKRVTKKGWLMGRRPETRGPERKPKETP
jgi:hypothetical protein